MSDAEVYLLSLLVHGGECVPSDILYKCTTQYKTKRFSFINLGVALEPLRCLFFNLQVYKKPHSFKTCHMTCC